ncbi:MAG: hypothetical protein JWN65_2717 [Solirubrobacterales bacterium]|nr:hypothetical protein [Solirubrobacterales bacterium]
MSGYRTAMRNLLVLVLFLAIAGSAQATVRAGGVQDGLDNQYATPSLSPRPALLEVVSATASYDDTSGTVTASVTFNQPAGAEDPLSASVQLSACSDGDGTPSLAVIFGAPAGSQASAELEGFDGTAYGTSQVSVDNKTLSATVSNPNFAHRAWRCVDGVDPISRDRFSFYFKGYDPKSLEAKLPVRLVCNDGLDEADDFAGIYTAYYKPSFCFYNRDDWVLFQTLTMRATTFKRWGQPVAFGYGTLTYKSYRRKVKLRLYGLRVDCIGRYRVYTRVQVQTLSGENLGQRLAPEACPTE